MNIKDMLKTILSTEPTTKHRFKPLHLFLLAPLLLAACGEEEHEPWVEEPIAPVVEEAAPETPRTPEEERAYNVAWAQRNAVPGCERRFRETPYYSSEVTYAEITGMDDDNVYAEIRGTMELQLNEHTEAKATCALGIESWEFSSVEIVDKDNKPFVAPPHPAMVLRPEHYPLYCEARYYDDRFLEEWHDIHGEESMDDLKVGDVLVSEGDFIVSPYAPHETPMDSLRAIGENRKPPAGTTMELLDRVIELGGTRIVTYFVRMPDYNAQGWVNSASMMDWYDTEERSKAFYAQRNAELEAYMAPYKRQLLEEHGFHYDEFVAEGGKNKEWHQRCIDEERARDDAIEARRKAENEAKQIRVPNRGSLGF